MSSRPTHLQPGGQDRYTVLDSLESTLNSEPDSTMSSLEEPCCSSPLSSLSDFDELPRPSSSSPTEESAPEGWFRSKLRKAGSAWSNWRSSDPNQVKADPHSSTWKNKISSTWNSIKYSEKWMHFANDDYSSDGFKRIVLLGLSYCPEDSDCDCGMDFIDFYRDYYTRIWITYRTGMPAFSGTQITSDCGWGCMIRTTQMALAEALVVNRMTRRWRYYGRKQSQRNGLGHHDPFYDAQIEVLKLFEDCPSAPLGIHRLVEISSADDPSKNAVGRWYAPSEVISLMRRALRQSASPLTSDLSLMLAVDGRVTVGDAERESRAWAKRLLLFVPLRLGTSSVNPVYHDHIRHMLSLESCLGILGGKPDHSLYFIGYYGRNVIYLDPHVAHEYIPMSSWDEPSTTMDGVTEGQQEKRRKHPLSSYHCRSLSKMPMKEMDPSCVVGFMFRTKEELDETFRILNLHQVVDVDLGPGEGSKRTRDPLFTVQYQETTDFDYVGKASEEERRQALEHGFELL